MRDYEHAMRIYAGLAYVSRRKRQSLGEDRFLLLTGIQALRAGWPDVAERCRTLVMQHNPRHLLGQYETFADALRDPDFQPFVRKLERFCPIEQAETLFAAQLPDAVALAGAEESAGAEVLRWLSDEWQAG